MKRYLRLVALILILVSLCGCGELDISDYGEEQILITGLTEEDFYITPNQLLEMECVSATAKGKTAKAGTVQAYGPTMETFLTAYGTSLDELYSIKLIAADDYKVNLGRATWEKYDIILSVAKGNRPLDDYQQPLRIVIPGGDSGNWARMIIRMEFTYKDSEAAA